MTTEPTPIPAVASLESEAEDPNDNLPPLDLRVIDVVKAAPGHTIRPARLAAELGISVDDACAELCGLLAAVGNGADNGASFSFVLVEGQHVMEFKFPLDFRQRALRKRRQEDAWQIAKEGLNFGFKVVKVATAFGLILSLLILCVAAIMGLLAAIVAMSRGASPGDRYRHTLMRQVRSLFYTIRQLVWFYALFGPTDAEGQHPFLREVAYDISLVCSLCYGGPASLFFWMRAGQLSRRRNRAVRGWGGRNITTSDFQGVSLIQRNRWGDDEDITHTIQASSLSDDGHRGVLSIAVEFLFGPSPFSPGPSQSEKWKFRAVALVQLSSRNAGTGVSLEEMSPLADFPPASLQSTATVVEQGLSIVAHFNGVPVEDDTNNNLGKAKFVFPELMAESVVAVRHEILPDDDDGSWATLFYMKTENPVRQQSSSNGRLHYMKEFRYRFTKLSLQELLQCLLLGALNLVGVLWLGYSLSPGGVLEVPVSSALGLVLRKALLPVLRFYAFFFFCLPGARLAIIISLNLLLERRNKRREQIAQELRN